MFYMPAAATAHPALVHRPFHLRITHCHQQRCPSLLQVPDGCVPSASTQAPGWDPAVPVGAALHLRATFCIAQSWGLIHKHLRHQTGDLTRDTTGAEQGLLSVNPL